MSRNFIKFMLSICGMVMLFFLSGCNKKGTAEVEYLAVQISKGDRWSIIDKNGKVLVKEEYPADAQVSAVYDGVYWVKSNDKYQLFSIESPKKPLSDQEYTWVTPFQAGRAVVSNLNQPIRIVDTKGRIIAIFPENVKQCYEFSKEGYAVFKTIDDLEGLINTNGDVVVDAKYKFVNTVSNGVLLAAKPEDMNRTLILNTKGEQLGEIDGERYEICPPPFFSEGKLPVKVKDEEQRGVVVLDKKGKKIFTIRRANHVFWQFYHDGYIIFIDDDGKYGVADDKGEIMIRAKYDYLYNYGCGEFAAKRDNKWGVINTKDEVIIDFDYNGFTLFKLDNNYVMLDGGEYVVLRKDGKERFAFEKYGTFENFCVQYINVESIADNIMSIISELEHIGTAAQMATRASLKEEENRNISSLTFNKTIGEVSASGTIMYDGSLLEEKTHTEKVNDGWFTYDRTVSDGYGWTEALPESANVNVTLNTLCLDADFVIKSLCDKLARDWIKILDGVYSKNVKLAGKTIECRTTISKTYDRNDISLQIKYRK